MTIQKVRGWAAAAMLVSFIVPILTILTVVFTAGGAVSDISDHTAKLSAHEQRIQMLEIQAAVTAEKMDTVTEVITEIRTDVKELLKKNAGSN